jgi:hypothetical protein
VSTELAWAAGFFEGEGTVSMASSNSRPQIAVAQYGDTAPELLQRWVDAVGVGRVLGPYDYRGNGYALSLLYVVSLYGDKAARVMEALRPYLTGPKMAKFDALVEGDRSVVTPRT